MLAGRRKLQIFFGLNGRRRRGNLIRFIAPSGSKNIHPFRLCFQSAICPWLPPSLRSFTIRQGCSASFTYNLAFVPATTILTLVQTPGSISTYDSYTPGFSVLSRFQGKSGAEMYYTE